jgi:glycerol uptake facilitator protein
MFAQCFGEFMGTLVLVLLGDGAVANVLLKRSKAEGGGWMAIASGWAFAVMADVFTAIACGSSDAHLNPAVTMGFALSSGEFAKFVPYLIAQMAGAFVGAVLVWLHFLPHWKETTDQGVKTPVSAPRLPFSLKPSLLRVQRRDWVHTLLGHSSGASDFSLGGTTGYAINPARDLGPRLAHALLPIAGKGVSDWSYAIVPVLGPLIGGGLAILLRAIAK